MSTYPFFKSKLWYIWTEMFSLIIVLPAHWYLTRPKSFLAASWIFCSYLRSLRDWKSFQSGLVNRYILTQYLLSIYTRIITFLVFGIFFWFDHHFGGWQFWSKKVSLTTTTRRHLAAGATIASPPVIIGLDQPKDQAENKDVSNHGFASTLMLNKAEKPLNTQGWCCLQPAGLGIS